MNQIKRKTSFPKWEQDLPSQTSQIIHSKISKQEIWDFISFSQEALHYARLIFHVRSSSYNRLNPGYRHMLFRQRHGIFWRRTNNIHIHWSWVHYINTIKALPTKKPNEGQASTVRFKRTLKNPKPSQTTHSSLWVFFLNSHSPRGVWGSRPQVFPCVPEFQVQKKGILRIQDAGLVIRLKYERVKQVHQHFQKNRLNNSHTSI